MLTTHAHCDNCDAQAPIVRGEFMQLKSSSFNGHFVLPPGWLYVAAAGAVGPLGTETRSHEVILCPRCARVTLPPCLKAGVAPADQDPTP